MQPRKEKDVVSLAQERLIFLKEKPSVARLASKGFDLSVVDDPQGLESLSPLDENRKVHTFQQRHDLQFGQERFFTVDFRFRPYMRDSREGEITVFMAQ